MKKKLLYQVFAVIMMVTFLVTGCGQSGNDSKASKSSQRSEEKASDKEKKVCNKKPDRDNAPPSIAAIRMRGSRIFQIILYSTASPSLMNNILNIFGTEICTFPVLIFNTMITKNAARSPRNTTVYLERLLKFSL